MLLTSLQIERAELKQFTPALKNIYLIASRFTTRRDFSKFFFLGQKQNFNFYG